MTMHAVPTGPPLPPGLYSLDIEVDPARFSSEKYGHETTKEDILEFGAFMVGLLVPEVAAGKRTSLMPKEDDIIDLYHERIGPGLWLTNKHGGIRGIQEGLTFYARGYVPDKIELVERYEWIAEHHYGPRLDYGSNIPIKVILEWCAVHDLASSPAAARRVLSGKHEIRPIFQTPEQKIHKAFIHTKLYRLGAQALIDNDGIPSERTVEAKYSGIIRTGRKTRDNDVRTYFGSNAKFWLEFDRVNDTKGLSDQEVVDIAIRYSIRTNDRTLDSSSYNAAVRDETLPALSTLRFRCGGILEYRRLVTQGLEKVDDLSRRLERREVDYAVSRAFCTRFESTKNFRDWLLSGVDVLQTISSSIQGRDVVLHHLSHGFDLLDEGNYAQQMNTFMRALTRMGITNDKELLFVLEAVPRVHPQETLAMIRRRS